MLALLAPLQMAVPVSANGKDMKGPAIVVVWATWCASCRAEMQRLPIIVSAANPLAVLTLAIDPPDLARRALEDRHQSTALAYADSRQPKIALADWGGVGASLPLAVAIDRRGQVCGQRRGLLGTDQIKRWVRKCFR